MSIATFNPTFKNLFGEVKNVFRWYDTPNKRNSNRIHCKGLCDYKLLTPANKMLSFQLPRETTDSAITFWRVYDSDDALVTSLDVSLLQTVSFISKDYIIYDGRDINYVLPCGKYTSIISDGTSTWYSEEFYVMPFTLGDNLMLESTPFDCFTEWPTASGFECDMLYRLQANAATGNLTSDEILSALTLYKVTIEIGGTTTGSVQVTIGDGDYFVMNANGSYTFAGYSELGTEIKIDYMGSWDGYIQVITVREVSNEVENCNIKIEWNSSCGGNIGNIYYGVDFSNILYLAPDVEMSDPMPVVEKEASLNGNKRAIPQWQKRTTKYKIETGLLPYFVVDALVEAMLHDTIDITIPNGFGAETVVEFDVDINWTEQGGGCYAECLITFELDDATIVTGCCSDEFAEITIPQCCYTVDIDIDSINAGTTLHHVNYDEIGVLTCAANPPELSNASDVEDCLNSLNVGEWTAEIIAGSPNILRLTVCQNVPVAHEFVSVGYYQPIADTIDTSDVFSYDC